MSGKLGPVAIALIACGLLAAGCESVKPSPEASMEPLLLDDFSSDRSRLGTAWEGFTDRVMGGLSDLRIGVASEGGKPHLSLSGNVSLKNNGGFIQARLLLRDGQRGSFDARRYTGIRLVVDADGDGYYVFLRTSKNLFPWSFFMAPIPAGAGWRELRIPFSDFTKGDFGAFFGLDLAELTSLALVAYKKEFAAALRLRQIGFY